MKRYPLTSESGLPRRPFVFVNMAMTADGKIATANRKISSFGSPHDQEHLLELRATADAVMMGARTVETGQITMGPGPLRFRRLRLKRELKEYNLRVIVSRRGSVNPGAAVFRHRFSPIIILTTHSAPNHRIANLRRLADEVAIFGEESVDFAAALHWLCRDWGVRRLLCEGGGELNNALIRTGLVHEIHLTICPTIFGGRYAPTLADGKGHARLSKAQQFIVKKHTRIGDELFAVCTVDQLRTNDRQLT